MKTKRVFLIKESLKKKLKSKWFIGINIFIFILILLSLNIATIVSFFGGDFKESKTIIVKDNLEIYEDFEKEFNANTGYNPGDVNMELSTERMEVLEDKVRADNNVILLVINYDENNYLNADVYTNNGISNVYSSMINRALNSVKYNIAVKDMGLKNEDLQRLYSGVVINSKLLNVLDSGQETGKKANQYNLMGAVVVIIFLLPFFFLIVSLVQMIGAEINEEKANKSMEIIISNVSPKDHLIAKIISCTTFTFIQIGLLFLFVGIGNIVRASSPQVVTDTSTMVKSALDNFITPDIVEMIIKLVPILIVFFIITLITYALLAGVLASMTTNIDDFQQLQTPIMLIVSIGFYLGILAVIFEGSTFIKIMSYVPLVSFLLSPSLYMLNQVSMTSVIISAVIQGLFMVIVYKYGMKVYRVGILNYSGSHLWKKIIDALKK